MTNTHFRREDIMASDEQSKSPCWDHIQTLKRVGFLLLIDRSDSERLDNCETKDSRMDTQDKLVH
jgi:hypothetical protein